MRPPFGVAGQDSQSEGGGLSRLVVPELGRVVASAVGFGQPILGGYGFATAPLQSGSHGAHKNRTWM